ncbi:DUF177 domain-containing protein [Granulicatella sp. zg-ZJ]|uniref:YceD family protein n=1 Tax=Granulicatella sp. zg-ZJ TaxID=2678504 RepID=UPI0013D2972A|nr:YceD family protein [Granulicatella sp. zg-ZJ]NEW62113.1 DUF177 domain-containing protein [Granulicatella sp. zg-ZJ]
MKWSMKQIEEHGVEPLKFLQEVDLKQSLIKRESDIIDVSPVKLNGSLLYDNHSVIATFVVEVTVTLPSSRTLEPVQVPLMIDVSERYVEQGYLSQYVEVAKEEIVTVIEENYVDLTETIIDSILLSLPLKVLSQTEQEDDNLPSGNGWVLLTEDAYNMQKQKEAEDNIDPRLAGLKTLLLNEEDEDQSL